MSGLGWEFCKTLTASSGNLSASKLQNKHNTLQSAYSTAYFAFNIFWTLQSPQCLWMRMANVKLKVLCKGKASLSLGCSTDPDGLEIVITTFTCIQVILVSIKWTNLEKFLNFRKFHFLFFTSWEKGVFGSTQKALIVTTFTITTFSSKTSSLTWFLLVWDSLWWRTGSNQPTPLSDFLNSVPTSVQTKNSVKIVVYLCSFVGALERNLSSQCL